MVVAKTQSPLARRHSILAGAIGSYRPTAHPGHRRGVQVAEFAGVALIAENPLDARPRRQKTHTV